MRMELVQPFINAADAVLAETLGTPATMSDVSMEKRAYQRKGLAAMITIRGELEGRIIFDSEPSAAIAVASALAGCELEESADLVRDAVFEMANLVIGNAVTALNDMGFRFRVYPPELHASEEGGVSSEDTEALVMCFQTPKGKVYLNIAMRYYRRRRGDRTPLVTN